MKRKLSIFISLTLLINLFTFSSVYADSGASALPKDTPMQRYCYKYIAPKTQTNYKKIYSMNTSVKKLKVTEKKIMAFAESVNDFGGVYGVLGLLVKKIPYTAVIGTVTFVGGKALYKISEKNYKSLSTIKKGAKLKTTVYFKWRDPKKLTYSVKISEYFTFNGKKISKAKNVYFNSQVN